MSSRRRPSRRKVLTNVGLGVLAVATLGTVGFAVTQSNEPAPASSAAASYYASPAPVETKKPWPVMAVVGDSFASTGPDDWAIRTARCANYRPVVSGARSSGFVNPGILAPYGDPERIKAVTSEIPDVVIFETAYNDARGAETRPQEVKDATIATINAYKAVAPNAKYVILGPFPTDRFNGPNITNNVAMLKEAAAATGATHILPSLEWQPSTDYTKSDLAHPNDKGHRFLTAKLLVALRDNGIISTTSGCENML